MAGGKKNREAERVGFPTKVGRFVVEQPFAIVVVVVLALIAWYLVGTRSEPHHVRIEFASALSIATGLDVQIDGVDVGKVSGVKYDDGHAQVTVGIDDKDWPLPVGTRAALRYGTTLGNGTRRVDLFPPANSKDGPKIQENGIIGLKDSQAPVEFDQIFNTFDAKTRKSLDSFFKGSGDTFAPRGKKLNEGIKASPAGLEATSDVLADLSQDDVALRGLVTNADRAVGTLAARKPEIEDLLTVFAATMDEFAINAKNIQASLDQFAPALVDTRTTLARLDISVDTLDGLIKDLAPGAKALVPFVRDARPAVNQLARTMPVAVEAIRTARQASPDITAFLKEGQPFADRLKPTMEGLAPYIGCLRPYSPEFMGFVSNWASFGKNYDKTAHYARIQPNSGSTSENDIPPIKTNAFLSTLGAGLSYAMPRPPGLDTGNPIFMPECGYTQDALNPAKDPEDG